MEGRRKKRCTRAAINAALEALYETHSIPEAAEKTGVSEVALRKRIKEKKLRKPWCRETPEQIADIINNTSLEEAARYYHLSITAFKRMMKEKNICRRWVKNIG